MRSARWRRRRWGGGRRGAVRAFPQARWKQRPEGSACDWASPHPERRVPHGTARALFTLGLLAEAGAGASAVFGPEDYSWPSLALRTFFLAVAGGLGLRRPGPPASRPSLAPPASLVERPLEPPVAAARRRVLLVDAQPLSGLGIRSVLHAADGIGVDIVGETATTDGVFGALDQLQPDIVLLDLDVSQHAGFEIVRLLAARSAHVRTIVLASDVRRAAATELLDLGVHGLLLWRATAEELVEAVRAACAGRRYVQPELVRRLAADRDGPHPPTPKEAEALRYLDTGMTDKEIALAMGLEQSTVRFHLINLRHKLAARNRGTLVSQARKAGWL